MPRIKTLPLPTVAAFRVTRKSARVSTPVIVPQGAAVVVLGDEPALVRARAAVAEALDGRPGISPATPQVALVAPGAMAVDPARRHGPAPRVWVVAPRDAHLEPAEDAFGVVAEPVTARLVDALIGEAAADAGPRAEGSRPGGEPARAALVGLSALDDALRFADETAAAFGAAECRVWLREGAELRALAGEGDDLPDPARLSAEAGVPVLVDEGGDLATWLAVWCAKGPGEEPSGLMALRFDGLATVDGRTALLAAIATRLGVELGWLRLHRRMVAEQERLRAAAMVDPLTGAWTRQAFERTTEVELAGARRRGEHLSMLLFDVDGLRRINDLHGHAAGDAVIAHVAAVIRANVRVNDELGRFGDDELAVLLMNSPVDCSRMVAEKLIRKIQDTPLRVGGELVRFTVRAGVTALDPAGERTGDRAFARAARACEDARDELGRVATCDDSGVIPAVHVLDDDAQVGSLAGATLGGGYRILHEISRGASGVVYRGEDLGLGRPVAIKVLRHDLGRDQQLVAHFRREASILASLRHPNLVEVYAFGAGDDVYFVMELVEGPTAADVLDEAADRGEWLDPQAVAEMIVEIGDALEAMHAAGLVHCDVKPENIVLDRHAARAVLLDVGECKRHDEARRRAGTPGYAAPESFAEGDETAAIDVYSLAATAYTMLTGHMPFGTGDALAILARQLDAPPSPPSSIRKGLPEAVDVVIQKAMAIDPAQRFATPGAFAMALKTALRGADDATPPPRAIGQLRALTMDEEQAATSGVIEVVDDAERPMVRGAAFRVATRVLAARVGEPWLRRVAEMRRDLGELLRPELAPMSWQPLDLLIELVACATGDVDQAETMRSIGRGTVSVTFGHLYGADPTAMSTHGLLASVPGFWDRYFGFGACEVVAAGDQRVVLGVTGACVGANSADLVAGFLERITELTGARDVQVTVQPGTELSIFTVEWL